MIHLLLQKPEETPVHTHRSHEVDDTIPFTFPSIPQRPRHNFSSITPAYVGTLLYSTLAIVLYPVNLVLLVPIGAVLGEADFSTSIFGAYEWAAMASMMFYSEATNEETMFCSSAIAGALFGTIHCLAWHFVFPSPAEEMMWKVSSLIVVCSCFITFLMALSWDVLEELSVNSGIVGCSAEILLLIFLGGSALLYPTARICLLILALTSLRSLPSSAFDAVRWIDRKSVV